MAFPSRELAEQTRRRHCRRVSPQRWSRSLISCFCRPRKTEGRATFLSRAHSLMKTRCRECSRQQWPWPRPRFENNFPAGYKRLPETPGNFEQRRESWPGRFFRRKNRRGGGGGGPSCGSHAKSGNVRGNETRRENCDALSCYPGIIWCISNSTRDLHFSCRFPWAPLPPSRGIGTRPSVQPEFCRRREY